MESERRRPRSIESAMVSNTSQGVGWGKMQAEKALRVCERSKEEDRGRGNEGRRRGVNACSLARHPT